MTHVERSEISTRPGLNDKLSEDLASLTNTEILHSDARFSHLWVDGIEGLSEFHAPYHTYQFREGTMSQKKRRTPFDLKVILLVGSSKIVQTLFYRQFSSVSETPQGDP